MSALRREPMRARPGTRPGRGALALLAWLAVSAAACAPNHGAEFPKAFAEAERAEAAGRYLEAAQRYDAAAKSAIRPRDREHARYAAGVMLMRGGNVRDGVARFDDIAGESPPTEHSAEAAYRAASARVDAGDGERGWRDMQAVLERFSGNGISHSALRRLVVHKDQTAGKRATIDWLRALSRGPLGSSEAGEAVSFQIAEHLADEGDVAGAREQFVQTATRWAYPYGALWDDSLYRASEMDEKLGHYAEAIADLDRILLERETTTLVGTYQRPRMTPALYRIGVLYAYRLHDRAKARDAFHRLYTDFTTATMRPDALWQEAALYFEDGDAKTSCARLETLLTDFPDSRYVPCAVERCTTLKPADKSKAPKTCHPYLLRAGRAGPDETHDDE